MSHPTLPLEFHELSSSLLPHLRSLNRILFPVKFPESYYNACLANPDNCILVCYHDRYIGVVHFTMLEDAVYINTVGVLASYRERGIGTQLLGIPISRAGDKTITLHVKSDDEDVIAWYTKRGFRQVERINNYYRRLGKDAVLLKWCRNSELGNRCDQPTN
ncbi:Pre-mRNA-splicing factor cwf24 [Neolecta irregularis DAH-3]|uniref:Pre-mRNA-splicing factor cwf24 n=1 Tax=Neolecta irregularis (strain DAH-3) TaxID=1198029 RepID=A0A1U7LKT0_NEOID|nr:Pre-mRNA-splicing factor cwf24 [Neolecta irregularis DAH-3]|eukprot:OLL23265.1 Pre-mRNA-splicing factor cwf24 [Neolecta irregularis DAH-3]